jgi:hypothetical protein
MSQRFRLTTKELCESHNFSETTLRRLRKDQVMLPGVHFVIKGHGKTRPRLLWDPLAVEVTRQKWSRQALTGRFTRASCSASIPAASSI